MSAAGEAAGPSDDIVVEKLDSVFSQFSKRGAGRFWPYQPRVVVMMPAKKFVEPGQQREECAEAQFSRVQTPATSGEHPNPAQRREHARYKVELDVSLGSDHNFYVGFVENMSAGGVFIATHMLKAVGEVLELSIHIPSSDTKICGTGEVRWVREYSERSNVPPGMGVRFIHLEPGGIEAIEQFLARREPIFFDED